MPSPKLPPGVISFSAYARMREERALPGASPASIGKAVRTKRILAAVYFDATGHAIGIADPELADKEWAKNTDQTRTGEGGGAGSGDYEESRAHKEHWKALTAEVDFKKAAGELVLASSVAQRVSDMAARVRARLLGLPSRAKQALPHLSTEDVEALDGLVREALEALAEGRTDGDEN